MDIKMRAFVCLLVLGTLAMPSPALYYSQDPIYSYIPVNRDTDVDELVTERRFDLKIPCWLNPLCWLSEVVDTLKSIVSFSVQTVVDFLSKLKQPSLVIHFDGFCEDLSQVYTEPYSARTFIYDPNIDALLKLVFPNLLETQELAVLRQFLNSQLAQEVIVKQSIDTNSFTSCGAWLRVVVERALAMQQVQENVQYYRILLILLPQIPNAGPPPSEIRQVTIDFADVFRAFDLNAINANEQLLVAFKLLLSYMQQKFKMEVDLKGFPFQQCYTRADFLKAFLQHLQGNADVSQTLKAQIPQLLQVVVITGVGSAPVDYIPTVIAARFLDYDEEHAGARRYHRPGFYRYGRF
ncbi:uncharacterized protein [Periplaneta americana]|uniref:uncharacterized protein n=1 Tax=Periplaneta americana TaxID=6978 RepID=UPI0037E8A369